MAIKITEKLLYDNAFNLESYIIEQFGKALSNAEEDAFLNGDGNPRHPLYMPLTDEFKEFDVREYLWRKGI